MEGAGAGRRVAGGRGMGGRERIERHPFRRRRRDGQGKGYPSDIDKVGLGVLVEGGYLVTAAHCLEYDNDTGARITLGSTSSTK